MSFGGAAAMSANQQLVAEIARERERRGRQWRAKFLATWAVIVVTIVAFILFTVSVDTPFLEKTIPFILLGVPITLFRAGSAIGGATILAAGAARVRLSRNPYLNGI